MLFNNMQKYITTKGERYVFIVTSKHVEKNEFQGIAKIVNSNLFSKEKEHQEMCKMIRSNLLRLNSDSFAGVVSLMIYRESLQVVGYLENQNFIPILEEMSHFSINYVAKNITKGPFVEYLHNFRKHYGISNEFHDALIDYIMENYSQIAFKLR